MVLRFSNAIRTFRWAVPTLAGTAILFTLLLSGHAQDLARRLILKDGSYQLITKYEVKGDRVRYLSAERNEWEELPTALVDWPATETYERERTAGAAAPAAAGLELETAREVEDAPLPEVAPGLRLPEDTGVFLLDTYKSEPQLVELQQSAGDINRNRKGNIFHAAINPVASTKVTIELEGEHAKVQSHVGVPSFYLNPEEDTVDQIVSAAKKDSGTTNGDKPSANASSAAAQGSQSPQQPQQAAPPDRFRIVRAQVKGGKRIVGDVKRALTGKVSQEQHFEKTTITRVTGGWLKVTPTESLAPGEYALVEMMGKEGMNLYVWDFGVNPNAAANANPWKPAVKEAPKPPAP